jgi:hypothetical protein
MLTKTLSVKVETCAAVGENEMEFTVQIFPNPVTDRQITVVSAEAGHLVISDFTGRIIADLKVSADNPNIILPHISSGIYLASFSSRHLKKNIRLVIAE